MAAFYSAAQTAAGGLGPPFLSICPGGVNPPGIKILLRKMLDAADAAARFRSQKRRSGRLFPSPQLLYRSLSRVLLRLFFAAAAALADGDAVEIHLHREDLDRKSVV